MHDAYFATGLISCFNAFAPRSVDWVGRLGLPSEFYRTKGGRRFPSDSISAVVLFKVVLDLHSKMINGLRKNCLIVHFISAESYHLTL